MAEALGEVQMGNRAETQHTDTLVSRSDLQMTGHPATPQEPGSLSLKKKTQGQHVQEHELQAWDYHLLTETSP